MLGMSETICVPPSVPSVFQSLAAVRSVVGGEVEDAADDQEPLWAAGAGGADVLDDDGAGGGAVGLHQFGAGGGGEGGEVQRVAQDGGGWNVAVGAGTRAAERAAGAGVEVCEEGGAARRAVGAEPLDAVDAVVGSEVGGVLEGDERERPEGR